uniref:Uncharacterized protein n=1 Tax=Parascaris univalens TaxID=6257 RepID=A0A914ZKJ4_PARUN
MNDTAVEFVACIVSYSTLKFTSLRKFDSKNATRGDLQCSLRCFAYRFTMIPITYTTENISSASTNGGVCFLQIGGSALGFGLVSTHRTLTRRSTVLPCMTVATYSVALVPTRMLDGVARWNAVKESDRNLQASVQ